MVTSLPLQFQGPCPLKIRSVILWTLCHIGNILTLVVIVHNMRRYNKRALASLFVASSLGLQCSQDRMLLATHVELLRFLAVRPAQPNTQPAAPETCSPESRGVYSASYIMLV